MVPQLWLHTLSLDHNRLRPADHFRKSSTGTAMLLNSYGGWSAHSRIRAASDTLTRTALRLNLLTQNPTYTNHDSRRLIHSPERESAHTSANLDSKGNDVSPGKPNHLFDSDTTASDVIEAAARYWL